MEVQHIYGDSNSIHLDSAIKYSVIQGYTLPEKYRKKVPMGGYTLDDKLLKEDIDKIIKELPVAVLPFNYSEAEKVVLVKAEVTQFAGRANEAKPVDITLYFNSSFEMIEPLLDSGKKIHFFRALPTKALISCIINENGDSVNATINRYYLG